ncbi:MAG TPA: AI-2E family transporter [Kofleriaceae bacterium]|nr:AI-2E family transporter [Kofleriaceae bacterium]
MSDKPQSSTSGGLPPATPFDPTTTTGPIEPPYDIEPTSPGGGGGRYRTTRTAFGPGGWGRRMAKLWGFLGFCILVLILARHVVLPFVFALLVAYILAPIVNRMSRGADGRRRLPRGLAIIMCYLVLLAAVALFMVALLPRVYKDISRLGREAPSMYQRINDEYVPQLATWLEDRFPSLRPEVREPEEAPVVADVPLPPGTQFVVTPLPDGRMAVSLQPTGIELIPRSGGGVVLAPREDEPEPVRLEDRLRNIATSALGGLQSELGDVFRLGQVIITKVIKSIFTFFLVLMIAAFLLLDLQKIHGFARGLIPVGYRSDYDAVVAGIDRGLSGVIRGQLLICLVNGILTYIGLRVFGIKYSLILAMVAAVLSLIPIFGSILSTIPIVLAALVSSDTGIDVPRAVFITLWIIGIHFLEANFLNPKIIGTAAKIHPVLVIFALVLGEHSYGLVGALLAVPVAAIVQVFFLYFRSKAWRGEPSGPSGPSGQIAAGA